MFLAIQNLILVNRNTIQGNFWVSEDATSIWGVYGVREQLELVSEANMGHFQQLISSLRRLQSKFCKRDMQLHKLYFLFSLNDFPKIFPNFASLARNIQKMHKNHEIWPKNRQISKKSENFDQIRTFSQISCS